MASSKTLASSQPVARQRPAAAASRWRMSPAMLTLGALLLLGLALRLWFIGVNPIDPRFSTADDGDYYQRALRFAVTGQYIDDFWLIRPPLHVFFFAAIIRVGLLLGDPLLALPLVRGVQVALSLLVVVLGYDMARRLFNRRAGLVFAGVLALWFPLVEMPALFMSEPIFFYLLLAHMWLLVLWRDQRRPWQLLLAGLLLGMAALTRSPALYAVAFVLAFVAGTWWLDRRRETGDGGRENREPKRETGDGRTAPPTFAARVQSLVVGLRSAFAPTLRSSLVFLLAFALVVGPWTYRNYTLYNRLILVDTLGPVNLWLSLLPERIDGGRTFLMDIPQAERSDWASAQVRQILADNGPFWLVRNFWPHFQHIWKAQFVEDFFVKGSSYGRPLRESLPLGLLSDVMWFGIVALGLVGLTRPWREGAFRLVALGWIGYTILIVGIMHVEPRYLLPIWLMLALYAAKVVGDWRLEMKALQTSNLKAQIPNLSALALVLAFGWLLFSYRDYPAILSQGREREIIHAAGARAYAAGDTETAVRQFQLLAERFPGYVDGRTDLAVALVAAGRPDEAWVALGDASTFRSDVVRGAITRAQGKDEIAAEYFTKSEERAGEDVQALALEWLRPAPVNHLRLGNGLDFGYLQGFAAGEQAPPQLDGDVFTYRWLLGEGVLVLPLPEPLREGSVMRLRMASGLPEGTPLTLEMGGIQTQLLVSGGAWRTLSLPVPAALAGQQQLTMRLSAPTFIPAQRTPGVKDARTLSVMISDVWVR